MKKSDFYFDLDQELIAQHPTKSREDCRLLVLDRFNGQISHDHFYNLLDYLEEGDCLALNDSKVIPARLFGHRQDKEEKIEVLLLQRKDDDIWDCLVKPGKKAKLGQRIIFGDKLQGQVIDIVSGGQRRIKFEYEGVFESVLDELGNMPIPPYIHEKLKNKEDYQTVYARLDGSAAAPTAGLHFSREMLKKIEEAGVKLAFLTLHVGLGTFRPVSEENIEEHPMHQEFYILPQETVDLINETKKRGKRVISVGTTSTRTLEAVASKYGQLKAESGWTDIFIYPGYEYKVIDGIITNFHLPESSLIMMIAALCGRERILKVYNIAAKLKYRFFSFGDAMLIVPRKDKIISNDDEGAFPHPDDFINDQE